MDEVTFQQAYEESCLALGELTVAQRFMTRRVVRLEAELAAATPEPEPVEGEPESVEGDDPPPTA